MKKHVFAVAALGLTVCGCATGSGGIRAEYTPTMMYQGYSCADLAAQDERLRGAVAELKGEVDHDATNDRIMTGVGVVLFWPALFFIKGNGEAESQYATLKGQHEAIEQAFLAKDCEHARPVASTSPPDWNEGSVSMAQDRTRF